MTKRKPATTAPRRRRTPELAREEILDAAERLFATRGPDAVGIQDVGREAGISHPMVIHYFGTYEGLVRETLQRLNQRTLDEIQKRLAAPELPAMGELMSILFGVLRRPAYMRLMSWVALSGQTEHFPLVSHNGLKYVVDAVEARASTASVDGFVPAMPPRSAFEMSILLGVSAAHGYAIGKPLFLRGLGLEDSPALEAEFTRVLSEAVFHSLLRAALEAPAPALPPETANENHQTGS